ncbi:hypothetical protein B0H14DRAFT_1113114 [Mycena olivaceomarginata]|nr:hypothetical protein B0H14DRAFT_1113114 [Mycena olivaceomarginata]
MPLNITVLDQSPTVSYSPSREGASSSSWQSTWTGSSDSSYDSNQHPPSLVGATVEIEFIGTAISLYGQGTRGAYTTILDGGNAIPGSPSGSMLATYGGLSDAKHTIMLNVTQSQTLGFSYTTFTVRSDITPTSVVNSTEIAVTSGSTNSFFSTTGSGFNNQRSDQGYTRIDTQSAGSRFSFSCSNTSALFIYGTTNYDHQTFSVELDPGTSQDTRILNGTSKWFVLDNLLFWEAGMDPTQQYEVKITNLVDGSYTDLHSCYDAAAS